MKRTLERRLATVEDFSDPAVELEQYRTPADIAAHLIHLASMQGDIETRTVIDLGSGTGMLALGAALADAEEVVGLEIDPSALETARENERRLAPSTDVEWVRGNAIRPPLCIDDATVVMNPPFGAQNGRRHADRAFLESVVEIALVSYSIHNEGSQEFVESFAADNGGTVTHAYQASFSLPYQFSFHEESNREIQTEVFRIEWE